MCSELICVQCGETFYAKRNDAKRCGRCRAYHRAERRTDYMRAQREIEPEPKLTGSWRYGLLILALLESI